MSGGEEAFNNSPLVQDIMYDFIIDINQQEPIKDKTNIKLKKVIYYMEQVIIYCSSIQH